MQSVTEADYTIDVLEPASRSATCAYRTVKISHKIKSHEFTHSTDIWQREYMSNNRQLPQECKDDREEIAAKRQVQR